MDSHVSQIRSILEGKTLLIIPYMHGDWAWCHTRQWHALRYISVLEDVVKLLEEHPEYNYKWYMDCYVTVLQPLLDRKPQVIEKLGKHIKAGNIAICGGFSNVRPNMTGDEAYIRNMIYGRRKFRECFPGCEITVQAEAVDCALGHPQIPQLIKKGGFEYYRAGRPFEILSDKGLPRAFVWEGTDGTRVPVWWGDYGGMWTEGQVRELNRVDEKPWEEYLEMFYETELAQYIKTAENNIIWVGQGCDDCLPLKAYNSDLELKLPEIIEKWNAYEQCVLKFATPDEFFRSLDTETGRLPVYKGTIDICDVCYNIAWGGEKGLIALRLTGSDQLAAAEIWSAAAALTAGGERADAGPLWEDLLTANAHATAWLFQKDFDRMAALIRHAHAGAGQLTGSALRQIAEKIDKPENTLAIVFNPCGTERFEVVQITLPCGPADDVKLFDGTGKEIDAQVLYPYEFCGVIWENEAVLRVRLPPFGYTTISAGSAAIDSRRSRPYTGRREKEKTVTSGCFSLNNGILRLDFESGMLVRIFDEEAGIPVKTEGTVPWNTLRFERIDTDSYALHAGSVTGISDAVFTECAVAENGPVLWRVMQTGNVGPMSFCQTITLTAESRSVGFEVVIDFTENRGRLSCVIPVASGCEVWGGIPFGTERKEVAKERYSGDGWENFHRMYRGLFFSKDFSSAAGKEHIVSLLTKAGDRYFMHDTEKNELSYILTNSVHLAAESWERHVNRLVENSGSHRFQYAVVIDRTGKPVYEIADEALAYRMDPVPVEPYASSEKGMLPPSMSFFSSGNRNIRISAVYSEGDAYIIRFFETGGMETDGVIHLPSEPVSCISEDFIGSEDGKNVRICGCSVKLPVKPYEIITLRVRFG